MERTSTGNTYRRHGPLRQRVIVGQPMLLKELEGGGHLFQVVDLGPPLIGWAFALAHFLLYVDQQIDTLGRGPGPRLFRLARGGLPSITAWMSPRP